LSIEAKIIKYLRENPGATPRLIADALGIPLNQVRLALNKLRDAGYVVRVPGEGYYARSSTSDVGLEDAGDYSRTGIGSGVELVSEIKSVVDQLAIRVDRLEKEVKEIRLALEALIKASADSRPKVSPHGTGEDRLAKEVKFRKVMKISEALAMTSKPIDEYVKSGVIKVVSDLVVDPEFYSAFLGRFPIKKSEILSLSDEERTLMNAMIKEGIVYLHGGREYRTIQKPQGP
jgi:DNA-binding Lrp family transcriptional regulator